MHQQRFILKRKAFITLLISIFILFGCGQSEDVNMINEETDSAYPVTEDEVSEDENNVPTEDLSKPPEIPVNPKAEDIHYYSEDDIDLLSAMHRSVSDGENIYLVYGEPDLYVMPIGADAHRPANIDNPEGMIVSSIALDPYGGIHLLVMTPDHEECFIWQLDENYQVYKMIDISAYLESKQTPLWFLVDKDGTYYLQLILKRNGIIIDREGVLKHKFTPESLGISWTYEAAVGKDGEIYLVYGRQDERLEIGKFDVENCLIENENPALSFPGSEVFMAMSGGTDTNLLLYSPYSGAWACDTEKGILENRVPKSDISVGFDTDFWPLTFLPDGRLLVSGKAVNADNAADAEGGSSGHLLLKYIPVGN